MAQIKRKSDSVDLQQNTPYISDNREDEAVSTKNKKDLINEMNKLRELNAAFSISLEFVSEAVCICDIRGNVLHLNSKCRALFGVSEKESTIGLNFFERLVGPTKEDLLRSYVDRSGLMRWKGDIHLYNTSRRKELLLSLQSSKHITSTGDKYLSNVMTELLEPKEKTILESYADLANSLPNGLGVWHLENSSHQPSFRLIALNRVARERISPAEIEVGKTVNESLKEPHNREIAAFFANVLMTGKSAEIEEFSLDGKAQFSLQAFPLKNNCVCVCFDYCKKTHIPAEVYQDVVDHLPHMIGIFFKDSQGLDYTWVASNANSRAMRKSQWKPPLGMKLSQLVTAVADPKYLTAMNNLQPGQSLKIVVNDWTNELYNGGIFQGVIIAIPNNYIVLDFQICSPETIKREQAIFNFACQKSGERCPEDLKDIIFINQSLNPIAHNLKQTTTYPDRRSPSVPQHDPSVMYSDAHFTPEPHVDPLLRMSKKMKTQGSMMFDPNTSPSLRQPYSQPPPQQTPLPQHYSPHFQPAMPPQYTNFQPIVLTHVPTPTHPTSPTSNFSKEVPAEIYKRAMQEASTGLCMISPQGQFISINNAMVGILGYSKEELCQHSFLPMTHPEDVDKSIGLLRQMVNGEIHSFQMIKRYVHKHGHQVWCLLSTSLLRDAKGAPLMFISQVQPIDTIRSLINNLDMKKDDEAFQQLFIRSPIGIAILNRDGNLSNINRSHTEMLGYTAHEIMGKPYFSFFLKEDQEMFRVVLQRMIEGKLSSHSALVRYETKQGALFWSYIQMSSILDANGVATHVGIFFQEYTTIQKALNMQPSHRQPTKPVQWNGYP